MSRGAAARRRRADTEATLAVCGRVARDDRAWHEEDDSVSEENARLRDQLAEVEGWYRLLQVDHAVLKDNESRTSRRATELQTDVNRLDGENGELRALVARLLETETKDEMQPPEEPTMRRMGSVFVAARKHKWAAAAVVAVLTLLARDAAVQGVAQRTFDRVRRATGFDRDGSSGPRESGFVRYAAMVNSRDQLERTRREYNAGEATLKGDALLEAQDRLRAAKARYREARLAFLPELARECEQAHVALPREAAEALAALRGETSE